MRHLILAAALALTLAACQSAPTDKPTAAVPMPMPPAPAASVAAAPAKPAIPANPLVDTITPGDDANEKAHNQKGDNDNTGDWTNRTYRDSADGWFSWDVKVIPNATNELWVTYAGVDKRRFDVIIDGQTISHGPQPGSDEDFYDFKYVLTPEMTKDKQKVTVRFQSINNGYAGGVFGLRMMCPPAK